MGTLTVVRRLVVHCGAVAVGRMEEAAACLEIFIVIVVAFVVLAVYHTGDFALENLCLQLVMVNIFKSESIRLTIRSFLSISISF